MKVVLCCRLSFTAQPKAPASPAGAFGWAVNERSDQTPFLSQCPLDRQHTYERDQKRPCIQRGVAKLPFRLHFDFRFMPAIFDIAQQLREFLRADKPPAGLF